MYFETMVGYPFKIHNNIHNEISSVLYVGVLKVIDLHFEFTLNFNSI